MNWLSALLIGILLLAPIACGDAGGDQESDSRDYGLNYQIALDASAEATITIDLVQSRALLREMSFELPTGSSAPHGDGQVSLADNVVMWQPPSEGGRLEWRISVGNQRASGGYDAYVNEEWGIFRAEDVIPRARTRTLKGASSNTTLSFSLPPEWSFITEYSRLELPQQIAREGRRFAQPTGWIAVGKIGVRHETIAGTRVAIAGPEGQSIRRMDMLALLNWTLPELKSMLGNGPDRLTVISADDPMWRGGLSAPQSIFIHNDRPLISENATSTLLHELMHIALPFDKADGYDWITEGLAEYYSLELLHRGNAITSRRYERAIEKQQEWAADAERLCGPQSTGATTALAVTLLRALDNEIKAQTDGKSSLDDVAITLSTLETPVNVAALQGVVISLTGSESATLDMDNLPGCRSIATRTAN